MALNRQVTTKKAYGFASDTVKLPSPEIFSGEHNREALQSCNKDCETNFKLASISDTNTKVLLINTRLNKIVFT